MLWPPNALTACGFSPQIGYASEIATNPCRLPSKSPWLNPIEPKWVHGKRAIVEPDRLLSAQEVMERVYAYYGCVAESHLAISEKAA
jgi:hypothetical protein